MTAFITPCSEQATQGSRSASSCGDAGYVLEYPSRADLHPSYVFPCDSRGHVDLDRLSERQRNDYFYARVVVGNALAGPRVLSAALG